MMRLKEYINLNSYTSNCITKNKYAVIQTLYLRSRVAIFMRHFTHSRSKKRLRLRLTSSDNICF